MNSNRDNFNNFNANPNNGNNTNIGMSSVGGSGVAPPLPPRPNQLTSNNSYRFGAYGNNGYGFGTQFGNYSSLYCSPFNGLGSYGGYGFNRYNNFGNNYYGSQENDFVRIAEDSSRQAFQSIESIVQAFGSVSMMLESTYYAVHSSFRAVIGVADHFSRLRNHLAQILSTLALIRTFKWIIRRLLYLIGIRRNNVDEGAWARAESSNPISSHLTPDGTFDSFKGDDPSELFSRGRSSWPIIIFFGVVFGTPWLIWRLLSTITGSDKTASDKWMSGEDEHYEATALYDFYTDSPRELPFSVGQRIIVAPRDLQPRVRGWLLATIDGKKVGLIPANYVRILGCRNAKK